MSKMPAIFVGHGSPMIALEDNNITEKMLEIGNGIINKYGKPKAILMISAHWFVNDTFIQDTKMPRQVYDMYGFPKELYDVKYPVKGDAGLSKNVQEILGNDVKVNNEWGIDHGAWTVLIHMFPKADIPVVQLSVNSEKNPKESYEIGCKLSKLRDMGYLIIGSGNIVHNLRKIEWNNEYGSIQTTEFNDYIVNAVEKREDSKVIFYEDIPYSNYAVPTLDHYLPLVYILGATKGEKPTVFNNVGNLDSLSMTGFEFEI